MVDLAACFLLQEPRVLNQALSALLQWGTAIDEEEEEELKKWGTFADLSAA